MSDVELLVKEEEGSGGSGSEEGEEGSEGAYYLSDEHPFDIEDGCRVNGDEIEWASYEKCRGACYRRFQYSGENDCAGPCDLTFCRACASVCQGRCCDTCSDWWCGRCMKQKGLRASGGKWVCSQCRKNDKKQKTHHSSSATTTEKQDHGTPLGPEASAT
jgi:hypothetical protein